MPFVKTDSQHYTDIADAIRFKHGVTTKYLPAQMAAAVRAITGGVEPQTLVWDQIPMPVTNYLDDVTYDPTDYTTSQIANYAPAVANVANSKPSGKTVNVKAGVLDRNGYQQAVAAGDVTLYNDIPFVRTPYTVTQNGVVLDVGTLMPSGGFLRQLNCPTAVNVRDLGGWTCDGGTIKYGMMIRGGNPSAQDREVLIDQIGVMYELDLRGKAEADQNPSVFRDGIGYSVFNNYAWYSINDTALWRQMLGVVFDCVKTSRPVYFHCAAGADRTGTLACVLEALLGVSQSDIDKDYELTCFYSGTGADAQARRRNETEWQGLISAINEKSGDTFRDKAVRFVLELGFSIGEINAFRISMIDGTPEVLTVNDYSVTNTLTSVRTSNSASSVEELQPYSAVLTPTFGNVIDSVRVTMGGTDITSQVFSGTETQRRFSVSENLSNCSSDVPKTAVAGSAFTAHITPNSGYTLTGATIQITMGGTDVSQYYSSGTISIPSVTGNIVITATAVPSAPAYTNWIKQATAEIGGTALYNGTGYKNGYRYSSSMGESELAGAFITGWIPVSAGDVVHLYGNIISGTGGNTNSQLADANRDNVYKFTPLAWSQDANVVAHFKPASYDATNKILSSFTVPSNGYMRFSLVGAFEDGVTVITINEEMS